MDTKKGGRPRIEKENEIKSERLYLRFDPIEMQKINVFYAKYNTEQLQKSVFLRELLLQAISTDRIKVTQFVSPFDQKQLIKIGTNVNQLAKRLNSVGQLSDSERKTHSELINKLLSILDDR
jgi:ribosomal protein S4